MGQAGEKYLSLNGAFQCEALLIKISILRYLFYCSLTMGALWCHGNRLYLIKAIEEMRTGYFWKKKKQFYAGNAGEKEWLNKKSDMLCCPSDFIPGKYGRQFLVFAYRKRTHYEDDKIE